MKTVGEILKKSRLEKNLSLEQVEQATKIRKKFLEALENDHLGSLPSLTYSRGFIKNYADFLGLETNFVLSVFRRQVDSLEKLKILPKGLDKNLENSFFNLTPVKIIGLAVTTLFLLFFIWLFSQYSSMFFSPKIVLEKPAENEIIKTGKIRVLGKTDERNTVMINGQKVELRKGIFDLEITGNPTTTVIEVEVVNPFGKKNKIERIVRRESP